MKKIIKNPSLIVLLFIVIIMTTGCGASSTLRRYKNVDPTEKEKDVDETKTATDESNLKVIMNMSDVKIEPDEKKPTYKSLWDLQGQGQKAYLEILDNRYKDNDKYLGKIPAKYLKSDDKVEMVKDLTRRKVKLVFTIQRWHPYEQLGGDDHGFSLADRIEYMHYSLDLGKNTTLSFVNWNKYTTEYGSINIGDVSTTNSLSLTAGYGDTTSGFNASVTGSTSRTENQHIQYRYIQLNGSLTPQKIDLESEGTREVDLSGNVVVDVIMQFKPALSLFTFSFDDLTDDDGKLKKPQDLKPIPIEEKIPSLDTNEKLTGTLKYTYAYRHVKKWRKARTYPEWDDKVQYFTGTVSKNVNIPLPEDIFPNFWGIKPMKSQSNDWRDGIHIYDPTGDYGFKETELLFEDRESASDFLNWLDQYPYDASKLDNPILFKNKMSLMFEGKPLTPKKLSQLLKDNPLIPVKYFSKNNQSLPGPPGSLPN